MEKVRHLDANGHNAMKISEFTSQRWLAEIDLLTGMDSAILAADYLEGFDCFESSATLTKTSPR
jgi:hypothetical protein